MARPVNVSAGHIDQNVWTRGQDTPRASSCAVDLGAGMTHHLSPLRQIAHGDGAIAQAFQVEHEVLLNFHHDHLSVLISRQGSHWEVLRIGMKGIVRGSSSVEVGQICPPVAL